ncbi:unnamed protein product [Enterobius vermicularis]|uniref:17-beta-hydroxysteroid dehydrogenase type 6 n=1 Tax=Enterobius vermicularis TaxID=51028 RepID=A0A0N4VP81_ENTVE|nr:unnamed protein product [Enterobius vermicularis]
MLLYIVVALLICCLLRYLRQKALVPDAYKKTVFITGCDTGFGRLLVKRLLDVQVTVFAGCYTSKGEAEVVAENSDCSNLFTLPIDVTDDNSVTEAYKFISRTLQSRLWGIVNNAGIFSAYGPDDWLSIEEYQKSMSVNFFGSVRMKFLTGCSKSSQICLQESHGRIVTMASVSGRIHSLYMAPYTAAKFALEGYMDCLRLELSRFGVTVHIIEPGAFRTTLLDEKVWDRLPLNVQTEYGKQYVVKEMFHLVKKAWNYGAQLVASRSFHYVVDSYFHALLGQFPRDRYICGWDARFLWQPLSICPSVVQV